jgi:spore germination protein YaaH
MAWTAGAPASAGALGSLRVTHRANLESAATPNLQREVFGFVNYFNLGDPNVGYPSWHMNLLSTVAFFRLQVNSGNGYIVPAPDPGWNVFHSSTMTSFVSAAHASGTRVIVSINLHGTDQVCTGLLKANYTNTITETLQLVQQAGIDGVNLNYEASNVSCPMPNPDPDNNPVSSRDRFTNFVAAFRAAMPNGYLAVDTYSGSAEDNLEFFNVTGIAPYVDSMFVMAYDMDWANYGEIPLQCSSYCFNPVSPLNTYRFNVTKSMQQYTALVSASKVILGQPYYGSRGCVPGAYPAHQTLLRDYVNTTYIYASTIGSQTGVSYLSKNRDPSDGVSEWDTWFDSDWSCWREQYFDDVTSLSAKYDVVNADNLRGVGFFTLDYGGGSPELWNLIDVKFGTSPPWGPLGGTLTSGPDATSWSGYRADVFARGSDNGLYHKFWSGAWSTYEALGGALTSDPGVVSWGSNRIDVFARGTDSALYHKFWAGAWSNWESLGGTLTTGPDAASWSNGRLDVFVRGTDNALWHKFWDAGGWSNWESLGGTLASDPTAVSWGPNRIDVFAKAADNTLMHKWWDGARWNGWESLGGSLTSAPDAASCASGHLDVFATGAGSALNRIGFNGSTWGGWQNSGGQWTSEPGAVCLSGTYRVYLFARGSDNALWQTSVPSN